ncbi:FixH family protein [Chryseobacterium pennipullorum]|nr:FixH family protein [Chryseobacterium pennipullorum]
MGLLLTVVSCTLDKTDYENEINTAVPEHYEFKEAVTLSKDDYKISIEALNGTFYQGYNEIRLKVVNAKTGEYLNVSDVTFMPVATSADGSKASCPHRYQPEYNSTGQYYSGYAVFTERSNAMQGWKLYLNFKVNQKTYELDKEVTVQEQINKNLNMTSFTGNDGGQYFIALVSPQKPNVAENKLVAGIYQYNKPQAPGGSFPDPSQFSYSEVKGYTLLLDPRMPEPSMGNHSSPNNKDLVQGDDGLYHGVVNYTMTGNWTLNFIMLNQNGKIIKGTKVSTDFTPGVAGAKSELFIDTLF